MIRDMLGISPRRLARRLSRDSRGMAAVEFALVMPIAILLTAGIFEFVLFMYDFQAATDATRQGVRVAIIQPAAADISGLKDTTISCTFAGGSSNCSGADESGDADTTFVAILAAMQQSMDNVTDANIRLVYSWADVDDPAKTPGIVTPLVTVELIDMEHELFLLPGFVGIPNSLPLPSFSSSRLAHSQTP